MLGEDDRLEGLALLRREGFDQLLDRRIDAAKDGHADEQELDAGEEAPSHHVGGDGAHDEDEHHRGEKPQAGNPAPEDPLVAGEKKVSMASQKT